jgi:hypothetical protein
LGVEGTGLEDLSRCRGEYAGEANRHEVEAPPGRRIEEQPQRLMLCQRGGRRTRTSMEEPVEFQGETTECHTKAKWC